MSFTFNFDVTLHEQTADTAAVRDGNEVETGKSVCAAKSTLADAVDPAETIKEATEHRPPSDPRSLFTDAVSESVTIGALPPLLFLNEAVFERTASEREDREKILSRTAAQRSDLISGVYEGGLRVWECTYDLLELLERDGETFGEKRVLDLGCGAGLLGILALKRGAKRVAFQDYNDTVIQQLTLPNVLLNCQEGDEEESEEDDDQEGRGQRGKGEECKKKGKDGVDDDQEGRGQRGKGEECKKKSQDGVDDDQEGRGQRGKGEECKTKAKDGVDDDQEGRGKSGKGEECKKKAKEGGDGDPKYYPKKQVKGDDDEEGGDGDPSSKKRALDPPQRPLLDRCRFFSGDWTTFLALVLKETPSPKYDIIFTSETIYNTAYYPALHDTLRRLLAPGGLVYLATKAHYFGVGGGLHLFESFVEKRGVFSTERLWGSEEGLQRHIVGLRFNAAPGPV